MATSLCPGAFFWACSTTDFFVQLILIIIVIALVVFFVIFLYLRGEFGALFYHSDKLHIGLEVQPEGLIIGYVLKTFGAVYRISSGPRKGHIVIPRRNATFKGPRTPATSIVLGKGVGLAVNPYVAAYIDRLGGWPEWSGTPPPERPRDLRQFYLMFAKWLQKSFSKSEEDKQRYIAVRIVGLDPPENLTQAAVEGWLKDRRTEFAQEYDERGWGELTSAASRLEDPQLPDAERFGIYEQLNAAVRNQPRELWPTWIEGEQIDARVLADWAEPVGTAAEEEANLNAMEKFLKSQGGGEAFKILMYGFAVMLALVGVAVLVHEL